MAVLAELHGKIIIDIFGKKEEVPCTKYSLKNDLLVYENNKTVIFYNILDKKTITKKTIESPVKQIKISDDIKSVAVLLENKSLVVYQGDISLYEIENVTRFDLSNEVLCYIVKNEFFVQKVGQENAFFRIAISVLDFFAIGDFCLLATKKGKTDTVQKIIKISEDGFKVVDELESIEEITASSNKFNTHVLLNIATSYSKNSYYAHTVLYLFDVKSGKSKKLPYVFKVHDVCFTKKGFAVCYGDQPSTVIVFDLTGKVLEKYPKGLRNMIRYNVHETYVIFAGFGQLPGDIEMYETETKKKVFEMNVLGASILEWCRTGSYFYVSITEYFKEDNNVEKYDYYGRKIARVEFPALVKSHVYGRKSIFIELEKPSSPVHKKTTIYRPPGLEPKFTAKSAPQTKPSPKKTPEPVVETEESLRAKLEEIKALKEKMGRGEHLSSVELNSIMKEHKIKKMLDKMVNIAKQK